MKQFLAIFISGGLGAFARFLLSHQVHTWFGTKFPYGVLTVNVLGSLLMGILAVIFVERFHLDSLWNAAILIGFLGAFTTFSSFSIDTINLFEAGAYFSGILYVVLSLVLCVSAAGFGVWLARI